VEIPYGLAFQLLMLRAGMLSLLGKKALNTLSMSSPISLSTLLLLPVGCIVPYSRMLIEGY
jgi:hypothetical protein